MLAIKNLICDEINMKDLVYVHIFWENTKIPKAYTLLSENMLNKRLFNYIVVCKICLYIAI